MLKAGDPERLVCTRCEFVFYLDPKLAVGTIISDERGRVVLVRRAIEPGYGKWVFPGGYVDRGEQLQAAAVREAREETGLDVRLDGLIDIYSYPGHVPVIVVYAATMLGGCLGCDERGSKPGSSSLARSRGTTWRSAVRGKRCGDFCNASRSDRSIVGRSIRSSFGSFERFEPLLSFEWDMRDDPTTTRRSERSGYRDFFVQVDVLNGPSSAAPSFIGRWNALRPEMSPMPPARLLITAVLTASLRSLSPAEAPPELMSGDRPM